MSLQYEILERIAAGGMAEVYRARAFDSSGEGSEVCIKRILPHLTQDPRSLSMFVDEARLAATLNCPQIVQVYDLCKSPAGEHFIVMEFVEGMDVARLLSTCRDQGIRVPVPVASRIAVEICKGLQYAHEKKDEKGRSLQVIHRDISPQNILVSRSGDVKITDFGIAKSAIVMTTTAVGILKGKYGYMSPEQASGLDLDHRSDLFNVGILLYEMLVGERCFAGASDHSTLQLMRDAEVVPPRRLRHDLNPDLEGVVLKALARARKDRFSSARQLEQAVVLCPGAYPCEPKELAEFVQRVADLSQSPRREETGVLSLASIVEAPSDRQEEPLAAAPPRRRSRSGWGALAVLAATALGFGLGRLGAPPDVLAEVQLGDSPRTPEITLMVDSRPQGAKVELDGVEMAGTTPLILDRPRDQATHELVVRTPDHRPATRTFTYDDGSLHPIRVRLEPIESAPLATIEFRAHPESEVWVEERRLARGRAGRFEIPAGRPVVLSFRTTAGIEHEVTVEVPAGGTRRVVVDLDAPGY
jgi:serine/threonine protein kinase